MWLVPVKCPHGKDYLCSIHNIFSNHTIWIMYWNRWTFYYHYCLNCPSLQIILICLGISYLILIITWIRKFYVLFLYYLVLNTFTLKGMHFLIFQYRLFLKYVLFYDLICDQLKMKIYNVFVMKLSRNRFN